MGDVVGRPTEIGWWPACPGLGNRAQAFPHKAGAKRAQKDRIGNSDCGLCRTLRLQPAKQKRANPHANDPADGDHKAHAQIDAAPLKLAHYGRHGRGCGQIGPCSNCNRGGNAHEHQKRRHQKAATNPKDARQAADHQPQSGHEPRTYCHFRNGQIDLHERRLGEFADHRLRRMAFLWHPVTFAATKIAFQARLSSRSDFLWLSGQATATR